MEQERNPDSYSAEKNILKFISSKVSVFNCHNLKDLNLLRDYAWVLVICVIINSNLISRAP